MNETEIFLRIRSTVAATFHLIPETLVTRETTSATVDGWDSLSHAILIMNIEDAFGIELPFEAVSELANVGELADLVESVTSAKQSGSL